MTAQAEERAERIIVLVLGLLTGLLMPAIALLAFANNLSALQRRRFIAFDPTNSGHGNPKRNRGESPADAGTRAQTWALRIVSPSLGIVISLFRQLLMASAQPRHRSRVQCNAGVRKTMLLRFCIQVPSINAC